MTSVPMNPLNPTSAANVSNANVGVNRPIDSAVARLAKSRVKSRARPPSP